MNFSEGTVYAYAVETPGMKRLLQASTLRLVPTTL